MRNYLLMVLLPFISSGKVMIQGRFSRKNIRTNTDCFLFNTVCFALTAAMLAVFTDFSQISWQTWLYGGCFGISSIIFQTAYARSMKDGPVSLAVMFTNFNVIFTVLFGVLLWDEKLSWLRIAGLALFVLALLLSGFSGSSEKKTYSKTWIIEVIINCFICVALNLSQKAHQHTAAKGELWEFVFIAYAIATVISLVMWLVSRKGKDGKENFGISADFLLTALGCGLVLAFYQRIVLYLSGVMDGGILYPFITCMAIILSSLSGLVLFKDKLSRRQLMGLVICIVAILLVSL